MWMSCLQHKDSPKSVDVSGCRWIMHKFTAVITCWGVKWQLKSAVSAHCNAAVLDTMQTWSKYHCSLIGHHNFVDVFLSTAAFTAMRHCTLYLAETLRLDVESRRHLRSGSISTLLVPSTRRATLGDRAFPVAAARAWNALPSSVRTSSTYLAFRRQLKTLLFKASFEDRKWLRYLFVAQR